MVVLFGKTGQLGNRLFNISAFLANAVENSYSLKILGFEEYFNDFENINEKLKNLPIKFINPEQNKYSIDKLILFEKLCLRKIASYTSILGENYTEGGNINKPGFINKSKTKCLFVSGWPYWDVQNFIKHSNFIKSIFTPKQIFISNCHSFIQKNASTGTIKVGVHIRRGDYKYYLDGKYFFGLEVFENAIHKIYDQLSGEFSNVVFFVCSNEHINLNLKPGINVVYSKLNYIEDLSILINCNYIIGVPSSYSMWASFYGNVPIKFIFNHNESIRIEDFRTIVAPNTFDNGFNFR